MSEQTITLPGNPTREESARTARRYADEANRLRNTVLTADPHRRSDHTTDAVLAANSASAHASRAATYATAAYAHGYHHHAESAAKEALLALQRTQAALRKFGAAACGDDLPALGTLVTATEVCTGDALTWVPTLGRLSQAPAVHSTSHNFGEIHVTLSADDDYVLVLPDDAQVRVVR